MTSKVCRISLKGVFLLLLALTFLCCKLSGRKEEIFRKAVRGDSSRSVGTQWREKQRQKRNKIKNKSKVLQTTRSIMEYNRQCQLKIEKESNVKNVSINALLFFENFDHLPYPMKPYEGLTSPCSFSMADCQMEIIEHQLVETFIKPEDGVVEVFSVVVLTLGCIMTFLCYFYFSSVDGLEQRHVRLQLDKKIQENY
jgi:hypothetical protein